MNICLVIISDAWAGAETVVHELARHLQNKGQQVSILMNQEILHHYSNLDSVKLINIGSLFNAVSLIRSCVSPTITTNKATTSNNPSHSPFYVAALLREIYYKRAGNILARYIADNKYDVIHANLNAGIVLTSRLLDFITIPVIATLHGQSVAGMPYKGTFKWITNPVGSWRRIRFAEALHKANLITTVSYNELYIAKKRLSTLKDKAIVIPNGVNIGEIINSVSEPDKLKGQFNLLFPGGTKYVKGGDLLLEALVKVRERAVGVHLYFAGDVPINHSLRKQVAKAGLSDDVTFTGFLPINEYRQLLNSIDLLIAPSREESFGIVFLEAMALGKPVIGSITSGIPEVVTNGRNGILVTLEPGEIAEAILYLRDNEKLRQQISENNLEDVTKFDWSNIIDRYIEVYAQAMGY